MNKYIAFACTAIGFACLVFLLGNCTHKPVQVTPESTSKYPKDIDAILATRCATAGCHNQASYQNAGGLLLDSWEHLFNGGNNGAVVVPYSSKNSSLLFFTNTDPSVGPTALPTMPLNESPLTKAEYDRIKKWIDVGAPDIDGNIAFGTNPETRQKIYLSQQGCDMIAVLDAMKNVVMRYIPIGMANSIEAPHYLRFSPDGQYAFASFTAGEYVQKIDVKADTVMASAKIGIGLWNAFTLTPDGKQLVISDYQSNGGVLVINTDKMEVEKKYLGAFTNPHGIASNARGDTFFISSQYGNTVYKFSPATLFLDKISIDENPPSFQPQKRDPHEILMALDYSKYFLTCQFSNEVRVMDAYGDTLLKSISVGKFPQEMAMSKTKPYLFVSCTEDVSSYSGYKGSIYVINYQTLEIVKKIDGKFSQPHGITVDDNNGLVYISNRNVDPSGPAPHHSSSCNGRNGYYNIYNLNTLEPALVNKRYEILVDPYSADIRFK